MRIRMKKINSQKWKEKKLLDNENKKINKCYCLSKISKNYC